MFDRFRLRSKREREEDGGETAAVKTEVEAANDSDSVLLIKQKTSNKKIKQENGNVELKTSSSSTRTRVVTKVFTPKWQERWHSICDDCFQQVVECTHFKETRLRLLIVGHNPSDHAWQSGFAYSIYLVPTQSNPSNRMWSLLTGNLPPLSWRGILPAGAHISEQNLMPFTIGVGFTSIGLEPGNDAAQYNKATMLRWKNDFFRRLQRHVQRVCKNMHGSADNSSSTTIPCSLPHSPMLIAFSGKRQFSNMFTPPLTKVENFGKQSRLPQDWPQECLNGSEVWVLPSSSGRAVMTKEQRARPYQELAKRLQEIPWTEPQDHLSMHFQSCKTEPLLTSSQ